LDACIFLDEKKNYFFLLFSVVLGALSLHKALKGTPE
jgi:hypothetical protein